MPARRKLFILLTPLFSLLAGFLIYAATLDSFFQRDSFRLIGSIQYLGPIHLWSIYGFFRPLSSLSYFIDYQIWFLNPVGYHLVNIAIHALNAYLVGVLSLLLLRRFVPTADKVGLLSLGAGILFLISPSHCKAVNWIPARPNLMVTFFLLSSFITYIHYREKKKPLLLLASMALFVCGLLSKESAATFPLVLIGYEILDYFTSDKKPANFLKPLLLPFAFLILVAIYPLTRYMYYGTFMGGYALDKVSYDLGKTLPNLLTAFFRSFVPHMHSEGAFDAVCLGITAVVVLAFFIIRITRRSSPPLFCLFLIAAFFISILPTIGMLAEMPVKKVTYARERFVYLPSIYSTLLIMVVLNHVGRSTKYIAACIAVIAIAYAPPFYRNIERWNAEARGAKTLLEHIKTSIHSNPNWREPKELQKILYESYRSVTGRKKIKPEEFRRIRNEYDLFDMYPPIWFDMELRLPDGTLHSERK